VTRHLRFLDAEFVLFLAVEIISSRVRLGSTPAVDRWFLNDCFLVSSHSFQERKLLKTANSGPWASQFIGIKNNNFYLIQFSPKVLENTFQSFDFRY
jgi:hypothetical protein